MNLQGGNRASSSSTRGCTMIPPPDRMPLLPCSHCEAEFYPVIARRVAFSVIARSAAFSVIARSAATKQSPVKVITTPCIQRGAGLAMTEGSQCETRTPFVIARPEGPKQSPGRRRFRGFARNDNMGQQELALASAENRTVIVWRKKIFFD